MKKIYKIEIQLPLRTMCQIEDIIKELSKIQECDPNTIETEDVIIGTINWMHKLICEENMKEDK